MEIVAGITSDPEKSELQHFSRRRADKSSSTTPSVSIEGMTVTENKKRPYTRWLGIYFDKKLTFKWHVRMLAMKALKVAHALRCFGNTTRGASPSLLRQAALSCVFPIAFYGAEIWWPGRTRISPKGCSISIRVEGHLSQIRKLLTTCARAILSVYRTTPVDALFRESGLLPPELDLDKRSRYAALRTLRLDPLHPITQRLAWIRKTRRHISRFSRWILSLTNAESVDSLLSPPWKTKESYYTSIRRITRAPVTIPSNIPFQNLVVFSDASCLDDGNIIRNGGGAAIYQAGRLIRQKCIPLSPSMTVFDAEAFTALSALEEALSLPSARFANDLWMILDNQKVARLPLTNLVCSSQKIFNDFLKQASTWSNRTRLPHTSAGQIRIYLISSHSGIQGNAEADQVAREARDILPQQNPPRHPNLHKKMRKRKNR